MSPACQLGPHATPMVMEGDEHRPWVVHVLELHSWMDEPLPEDYKGSSVVQKSEDLHGFTMIYHPTAGEKIM